MRYSEGSLRLLRDDLYQARYCYQMVNEEGRVIKKQVARNFHAASQKEAVLEKARIRYQLEREALIEDMLPCQKKNPKLSEFMFEQIDGMMKSGLIEPTTDTKARPISSCASSTTCPFTKSPPQWSGGWTRTCLQRGMRGRRSHGRTTPSRGTSTRLLRRDSSSPSPSRGRSSPLTWSAKTPMPWMTRHVRGCCKRLLSILDEMPDDQITLAIRLGLGAGLRNEEVIGLKWETSTWIQA